LELYPFGVVLLKPAKRLYVIVTVAVIVSIAAISVTEWQLSSGAVSGNSWYDALRGIVHSAAAVGVIWLGWHLRRLSGSVMSTAEQLKTGQQIRSEPTSVEAIDDLRETINNRIGTYSGQIEQFQRQFNDLQIQSQLAQKQKGNIEAIIYSLRDAVIVTDELDRLLMANSTAGELFNFNFRVSEHPAIDELIDASKTEFLAFLRQCRKNKTEATRREIELCKNGQPRIYDCIVSCVHSDTQQISGVVAVLHDITREKEISQMKNDFVSHVSHELKTPLASITAYSEMLADGEADDEQTRKEFYLIIQSQANRLNRLIDDILNISRIESGLVKVSKEPLSLTILLEEQLQMIRSYADEKNIKIITQKPIVYDQVYADKDMLSQVIVNLLSNAVKYTRSEGSVQVNTEVDENAGIARLTVTDTGVGIPVDEIDHVFDKFYRVNANNRQAKGTGLGLNLVKQIIEKVHDGQVFVKSQVGVGSTFSFELPLAKTEEINVV
jgi:two-component system phosphate regulon sensor histidine kinase PhoR